MSEPKIDPNFKGSIFEELGMSAELCDKCGAHLKGTICLNGCHIANFHKLMQSLDLESKSRKSNPKEKS